MMSNKTPTFVRALGCCSLALGLLAPLAAPAQTTPKLVTRDELRACMNTESDLVKLRQGIDARAKVINEEANALHAVQAELAAEDKRVTQDGTPVARERFDRKVRQHNARVAATEQKHEALRAERDGLNKGILAYNEKCGGISFDPADREAILKEQAK